MAAQLEVRPATLRDLCFTAANAREIDKQEIVASGPRTMQEAGYITWELTDKIGGVAYSVWVDGNPEFSFGFTRQTELIPGLFSGWAWGSDKTMACMVEISRWARNGHLFGILDKLGVARIEARSIHNHFEAHRWLLWLGFERETDLKDWGRNRERFVLFGWTRSEFRSEKDLLCVLGQHCQPHNHSRRHRRQKILRP